MRGYLQILQRYRTKKTDDQGLQRTVERRGRTKVCMRDMAQGDTCSITRLDAGRDGRMRCVRWIVRNILRQAMPNIMPATSTDAGKPVLAAL
ncbi:hypothetical protein ALC60_14577 [Trachymyrmex zeteki]|uniref:Uncharacterized protein n=1 Tax=Mycetomoellerius zeteki TaxID=64791 RepID=A0A151WF47_9HYME|nr:hypothetical protein ALC60_14577 [Trachymyrmex zeteki]